MTSQIGSDDAGAAELPARSATLSAVAESLAFTFMSAMLTYFGFMLQKNVQGRKDRTETVLLSDYGAIGPVRTHPYRLLPAEAKCWNTATKRPSGPRCKERNNCLLYTSPSPRDRQKSRMPSS